MSTRTPRALRIAVVGNGRVAAALSGWDDDAGRDVAVESVAPTDFPDGVDPEGVDGAVLDVRAEGVDAAAAAMRLERCS